MLGPVAEPNPVQQPNRIRLDLAQPDAVEQSRDRHVLPCRQGRQQVEELKDEPDAMVAEF